MYAIPAQPRWEPVRERRNGRPVQAFELRSEKRAWLASVVEEPYGWSWDTGNDSGEAETAVEAQEAASLSELGYPVIA